MGNRKGGLAEGQSGLNKRVVARLRDELHRRGKTYPEIAEYLGWGVTKVAFKFTGRTPLTLNELEQLCFAIGLQPTEAVREQGLEYVANMSPTELYVHQQYQLAPKPIAEAIVQILKNSASGASEIERRGLTKKRQTS